MASDLATRSIVPITAIVTAPDGSTLDVEAARVIAEELRALGERAPVELETQLVTMAVVVEDIVDAYDTGVNRTLQTGDFKAATIDVIYQCAGAIGN